MTIEYWRQIVREQMENNYRHVTDMDPLSTR